MSARARCKLVPWFAIAGVLGLGATSRAQEPAAAAPATAPVAPPPAQSLPRAVRVVQPPCELYDAAELPGLLQVELGALGVEQLAVATAEPSASELSNDLALIRVACASAPDTVAVQLVDLASGKALEREVPVASVEPKARARVIAMTAAGLVESSWVELVVDPSEGRIDLPAPIREALRRRVRDALFSARPLSPPPARAAPSAARDQPSPSSPPRSPASVQLTGAVRAFPGRATGLAGLGLGYSRRFGEHARAWLDLEGLLGDYELSDAASRIGSMRLYWLSAGLGVGLASRGVPSVAVGPFARAGYAVASGESARADVSATTTRGLVSALGLRGELEAPLSSALSTFVALEGGYMPHGVVFIAAQQRAAGMAEVALALRLGLSITL